MTGLLSKLPNTFNNYYESFVGGGALFFAIYTKAKKCYLSDINTDLIIAYKVIQQNPEELIKALNLHQQKHNKDYYKKIRSVESIEKVLLMLQVDLYTCLKPVIMVYIE